MPGYISNRRISFQPALTEDLELTQSDLNALEVKVTEAEENIEDLQLNIGV